MKDKKQDKLLEFLFDAKNNLEERRKDYDKIASHYDLSAYKGEYPYYVGLIRAFAVKLLGEIVMGHPQVSFSPPFGLRSQQQVQLVIKALEEYTNTFLKVTDFREQLRLLTVMQFLFSLGGLAIGHRGLILRDRRSNSGEIFQDVIGSKHPFTNIVPPWNMVYDPHTTDNKFHTSTFIGRVIYKPEEVWWGMKNRLGRRVSEIGNNIHVSNSRMTKASDRKMALAGVFEIYDRETQTMNYVTYDCETLIHTEPASPLGDLGPFVFWSSIPGLGKPMGASDAEAMIPSQIEYNETTNIMAFIRRMNLLKLLIQRNKINPADVNDRLLDPDTPMAAIEVEGSPKDAVVQINAEIPQSLWMWKPSVESDARLAAGMSRNETGEFATGRRSASEVQRIASRADLRAMRLQDETGWVTVEVVKRFMKLWSDFTLIPQEVTLPDGQIYPLTSDSFEIPWHIDIVPDSTLIRTTAQKREDAMNLLNVLVPLAGAPPETGIPQYVFQQLPALFGVIMRSMGYPNAVGEAPTGAPAGGPQGGANA